MCECVQCTFSVCALLRMKKQPRKGQKKSIRAYTNPTSTVLGSQREGLIFSLPLCCQTSQLLASAPSTVCVVWSRGLAHGTHLRLRYVLRRGWLDVRFAFSRVAGDASFPISPFKLQPLRAASTGEVFAIARCESRLPSARSHLRTGPNCSPF